MTNGFFSRINAMTALSRKLGNATARLPCPFRRSSLGSAINARLLSRPSEDHNEANNRMTKPFNEYACLRDCLIRWHYGDIATAWLVPPGGSRFQDTHLLAVPPPVNNYLPAAGPCLLWRGPLTSGGYAQGQRHRQAYLEANRLGHTPHNINHLCHRPFCVQPGHLYEGDAQDNADDRRTKEGRGLTFDMLGGKRLAEVAWELTDWWTHWYHLGHPIRLPLSVDCHHHAAPKTFLEAGGVFCQVCKNPIRGDLTTHGIPSIWWEPTEGPPETPRTRTYAARLARARTALEYTVMVRQDFGEGAPWVIADDFLCDLKDRDDKDALSRLWAFLGGPEGQINDPT